LVGGGDGILRVWDLKSGSESKQITTQAKESISCLVASKDGKSVVLGYQSGLCLLFKSQ